MTFGETWCATRIGNVVLEERISRSEVGCGKPRRPATALLVHQPRVLRPTQRRHLLATAEHSTVGLHHLDRPRHPAVRIEVGLELFTPRPSRLAAAALAPSSV